MRTPCHVIYAPSHAVYSHSRLGVYETCPRQYRFQYVDRLPVPEVRTVEMFVGSQVHSALEYLYIQVKRGAAPVLDAVLDALPQALDRGVDGGHPDQA